MDREALGKWSCISRVEDRVDHEAITATRRLLDRTRSHPDHTRALYPIRSTSTRYDHHDLVHLGSCIGRDDRAEIGKMSCGGRVLSTRVELVIGMIELIGSATSSVSDTQTDRQTHTQG
ncbi:hypothetical protein DPMN_163107 [Dreissena polymorpha]|uniref:Uncharacterized protein n=1 Tax=Dreissena polymorpha TaxID=45954 RepID=A0A9D4ESL5_DREPO|nr:hypothetical protein DPMN_163107 [Dreissena polymorpha]